MRTPLDFYETPPWQTRALLARVPVSGSVLECCVGDGSLARELPSGCTVATNDIDLDRDAWLNLDATKSESWDAFHWDGRRFDWIITNPPFNSAFQILTHAKQHARIGVIMLLRLSFPEPTKERGDWLAANPPTRLIVLPRWSYKANGSTDSVTTGWFIWSKFVPPGIDIVPRSEMPTKPTQGATE